MTKFLFFNTPWHGHVNPTLPIAQELVARGCEVIYYLTDTFKHKVEATGAVFRHISVSTENDKYLTPTGGPNPLYFIEESNRILPQILDDARAERPDCIIYDTACLWGRLLAQILSVPAICVYFSYATNVQTLRLVSRRLQGTQAGLSRTQTSTSPRVSSPDFVLKMHNATEQLRRTYHLPPLDNFFLHSEPLNIVCVPRVFQPASESFDERFVFVGPSIQPRREETPFPFEQLNHQPLLYISLGTISNDHPTFYHQCFEALSDQPWQIVLASGNKIDQSALGPVPDNFLVHPYVPQLEILQRANMFITHGGTSSIMEALYYGVPLVVVPQTIEQVMTASRVADLALGVMIENTAVTAQGLRDAVATIAHNSTIRRNLEHMQQVMQNCGGCKQAADAILQFAKKSK